MSTEFFPFPDSARSVPWLDLLAACKSAGVTLHCTLEHELDSPAWYYQMPDRLPSGPFEYPDAALAHAYFTHGLGEAQPKGENDER